jgi:uncharacterized RDD family membrane protein YckC
MDPQAQETGIHQEEPPTATSTPLRIAIGADLATAPKADLGKRIVAGLIDGGLAFVVGLIPVIGGLIAAGYWLVRDGLDIEFMDHRSIGKKIMKLRPVTLDGAPVDIMTSVKRNWMFAIGGLASVLTYIPIIGWLLLIPVVLVALVIGIVELVLVLTDAKGRRFGDKLAATQVVETAS